MNYKYLPLCFVFLLFLVAENLSAQQSAIKLPFPRRTEVWKTAMDKKGNTLLFCNVFRDTLVRSNEPARIYVVTPGGALLHSIELVTDPGTQALTAVDMMQQGSNWFFLCRRSGISAARFQRTSYMLYCFDSRFNCCWKKEFHTDRPGFDARLFSGGKKNITVYGIGYRQILQVMTADILHLPNLLIVRYCFRKKDGEQQEFRLQETDTLQATTDKTPLLLPAPQTAYVFNQQLHCCGGLISYTKMYMLRPGRNAAVVLSNGNYLTIDYLLKQYNNGLIAMKYERRTDPADTSVANPKTPVPADAGRIELKWSHHTYGGDTNAPPCHRENARHNVIHTTVCGYSPEGKTSWQYNFGSNRQDTLYYISDAWLDEITGRTYIAATLRGRTGYAAQQVLCLDGQGKKIFDYRQELLLQEMCEWRITGIDRKKEELVLHCHLNGRNCEVLLARFSLKNRKDVLNRFPVKPK